MRILLSNDDGILAPGLLALYEVLSAEHDVQVVAPESPQSASAHAITIRHPLICRRMHVGGRFVGTSVEGSPADCVKLAIRSLLLEKPDLVVSGLNAGDNAGIHVLYSGTVAAAAEGALLGCPAVAVSLELSDEMDFDRAARIAKPVIDALIAHRPRPGQLFNVNIPALKPGWPKGVRVAAQSIHEVAERFEKRIDPVGRDYYWLAGGYCEGDVEVGSDIAALREGYVSVTPLHFNLTHDALLREMEAWKWGGS